MAEATAPVPVRRLTVDRLIVQVYRTRTEMGESAAARAAFVLQAAIAARGGARAVFAAAPSQIEFLRTLASAPALEWGRVTAFHLDEYLDLPGRAPQAFGRFLREHLFDRVRPSNVWFLDGNAPDVAAEIERYGALLREAPLDLACVGIGENGHLAFNEPDGGVFDGPALVRVVALTPESRAQQVHDGCFDTQRAVPTRALTLTVPAIMAAKSVVCTVPGPTKRDALRRMLCAPASTACPASALRRHPDAVLFADAEAAAGL